MFKPQNNYHQKKERERERRKEKKAGCKFVCTGLAWLVGSDVPDSLEEEGEPATSGALVLCIG
jgi:hypothetical protein